MNVNFKYLHIYRYPLKILSYRITRIKERKRLFMVVIQVINEGGNESMAKWDEIPYETINLGNNHSWLISSLSKKRQLDIMHLLIEVWHFTKKRSILSQSWVSIRSSLKMRVRLLAKANTQDKGARLAPPQGRVESTKQTWRWPSTTARETRKKWKNCTLEDREIY